MNQFSAPASALGYLYQVRLGLLLSLRKLPAGADFFVSLETLDDVTFHAKDGTPETLLQSKFHLNHEATLTDSSAELWKTLRVWCENHKSNSVPAGTTLLLLTTAVSPPNSVASRLRSAGRDVDAALSSLEAIARTSTNAANQAAYSSFLGLAHASRKAILDDVVVLDASSSMPGLDTDLRATVYPAVERRFGAAFLESLEGWWFRRVIHQLQSPTNMISGDEIDSRMNDIREQFKQDSLPIDDDLVDYVLDEVTKGAHQHSVFVKQIELTRAGQARILAAIRDYYRAFEQRSRWIRLDVLLPEEHHRYEARLIDEWNLVFAGMKDDLGSEATDEIKAKAARAVLGWAEKAVLPIRARVTEPFVVRGSLHMLSDERRIGWHPEFRERLAALLGVGEASS